MSPPTLWFALLAFKTIIRVLPHWNLRFAVPANDDSGPYLHMPMVGPLMHARCASPCRLFCVLFVTHGNNDSPLGENEDRKFKAVYTLNRNVIYFVTIGKYTTFKITLTVCHRVSAGTGKVHHVSISFHGRSRSGASGQRSTGWFKPSMNTSRSQSSSC
jgi:hypothetical protein